VSVPFKQPDITGSTAKVSTIMEANGSNLDKVTAMNAAFECPRTLQENMEFRVNLGLKTARSAELQALLKSVCKEDIIFWINAFVYTYDPRKNPSVIPFVLYEFQEKFIKELCWRIDNQKDLLIDKSRDMGVTWCVLLVLTWYWQFAGSGFDFLVGSRKESYIDVMGNMDTLMEKIRFIIKNEPAFLRPQGFDLKTHSNYMRIINPASRATITGEATNNNFSRGGRRRAIFFDEFAFWECDKAAWRSSGDSTNCRVVVSTPQGFNNHFAELRHSGAIDTRTFHWKIHPEKNEGWYQNECARRNYDKIAIAQELDISYEMSDEGILFPWEDLKKGVHHKPNMSRERVIVAADYAGEGDDEAVIYVSNNGNILDRKYMKGGGVQGLSAECVTMINRYSAQVFICDAIGNDLVNAVAALLGKNNDGVKLIAFKSNEMATDKVKFFNKRAECYYNAAKMLKSGNVQMDDDYTLHRQLNATKYETKNGRIIIIPKEEIKKLISSSPDRADAWVLSVEGLKYTHSRDEVEMKDRYRQSRNAFGSGKVISDEDAYGSWGDRLDE